MEKNSGIQYYNGIPGLHHRPPSRNYRFPSPSLGCCYFGLLSYCITFTPAILLFVHNSTLNLLWLCFRSIADLLPSQKNVLDTYNGGRTESEPSKCRGPLVFLAAPECDGVIYNAAAEDNIGEAGLRSGFTQSDVRARRKKGLLRQRRNHLPGSGQVA